MSEYQYYEFRAIDHPLSREDMARLRKVSSRGEITSTSYFNEYDWGDFKGDPEQWMAEYFDAFLYYSNWGSKIFKIKVPQSLVDVPLIKAYASSEYCSVQTVGNFLIITFESDPDTKDEEIDYEFRLSNLIGIGNEILQGDYRSLYLGWLIEKWIYELCDGVTDDVWGEAKEPVIPPGLRKLTAAQTELIEFFSIDQDILESGARLSKPKAPQVNTSQDVRDWIHSLTPESKTELLIRVYDGAAVEVSTKLKSAFRSQQVNPTEPIQYSGRTFAQINVEAKANYEARIASEEAEEAAKRKARLDTIQSRLPELWIQIDQLIAIKKIAEYDQAIYLLCQIRELAERGDVPDYDQRIRNIRDNNHKLLAFISRMNTARLL